MNNPFSINKAPASFLDRCWMVWKNISVAKKLFFVVGIMASLIVIELFTLRFAMDNLSAVRAFVGGEGSWSKAQKNAIYQFQRYALTKNEKDYLAFLEALKIPEGDHIARLELEKSNPDLAKAREGFIVGQFHPDDIEATINLFRRFYWVSYIEQAIQAWKSADALLAELKDAGIEYHKIMTTIPTDTKRAEYIVEHINVLNDRLSVVEDRFSTVLGEGSRWLERLIFMILFLVVLTVEAAGLTLTFITSRGISKGLFDLNKAAEEFSLGKFNQRLQVNSSDEIGQLTVSINKMGSMLQKSYSDLRDSHQELEKKVQERTSELAKIADENELLYNKANEALKMRDEFLSIASHELKTPLTVLTLQLHLLERSTMKSGEEFDIDYVRNLTKKSKSFAKKLASLQEVLMDLTQIRVGRIELKLEKCDLAAIAIDNVSQLTLEENRLGSTIETHAPTPILGNFDPIRVSQVVTNLLSNAIKYGEGKPIKVTIESNGKRASVIVSDNGPGIPKDIQDQIFDRFERAGQDLSVSGLGLGLYITKQIVEAHGGTISVQSIPGKGSTFTAEFPIV